VEALIQFRNLEKSYDAGGSKFFVLRRINLDIQPGEFVTIMGPSGAGKSTLARLLYRFYDVINGRILIDGQDIRDVTQDSLRSAIGIGHVGLPSGNASRSNVPVPFESTQISPAVPPR